MKPDPDSVNKKSQPCSLPVFARLESLGFLDDGDARGRPGPRLGDVEVRGDRHTRDNLETRIEVLTGEQMRGVVDRDAFIFYSVIVCAYEINVKSIKGKTYIILLVFPGNANL